MHSKCTLESTKLICLSSFLSCITNTFVDSCGIKLYCLLSKYFTDCSHMHVSSLSWVTVPGFTNSFDWELTQVPLINQKNIATCCQKRKLFTQYYKSKLAYRYRCNMYLLLQQCGLNVH